MSYLVFTDGASRGNPGAAAVGAFGFDYLGSELPTLAQYKNQDFKPDFTISESIGTKTNNEAEYLALIKALETLKKMKKNQAEFRLDSKLIVEQMIGNYKVKHSNLKPLFIQAQNLCKGNQYKFKHVPRAQNVIADFLANRAY